MTVREERYEQFLRSRVCAVVIAIFAMTALFVASAIVSPFPESGNHGINFPSPMLWLKGDMADYVVLGLQLAVAALLVVVNHLFKLSRSSSITFASMFLVLQMMMPSLATTFQSGPILALIMLSVTMLMLASYHRPRSVKNLLFAGTLVSTGTLFQVAFIGYIPALLVGMGQMRVFRLKTLIALVMGLLAPWWVLWCFGITHMLDFHPTFSVDFLAGLPRVQLIHAIVAVGFTLLLGVALTAVNLLRIISLNSRTRATNGWLITLGLFTTIMLFLDSDNIAAYVTMLNLLAAFQIGAFMRIYSKKRSCYCVVSSILLIAFGLYIWRLWI